MPSFDIVSEVDLHQFSNAVDQASRVIETRFDFKGVDAKFERQQLAVTLFAEADFQIQQMQDMLGNALLKCNINPKAMDVGKTEGAGKQLKLNIQMRNGLNAELARKIVKIIKDQKLKTQAQIQGEQIRVSAKKRDDLQQLIAILRDAELEQPLQFNNFRD